MAEDHHGSQPGPPPALRAAPVTPDGRRRRSYETGESSATGSLRDATPSTERSTGPSANGALNQDSSPTDIQRHPDEQAVRNGRVRRRNRHRSGGGFLLQDAVPGDRDQGQRRRARSVLQHKGKGISRTPEKLHPSPAARATAQDNSEPRRESSTASPSTHTGDPARTTEPDNQAKAEADSSPVNSSPAGLDVDSTQIVNMALNLSESRRIASRRSVSRTNPPRLVPLPDSASRSNLRQHFQQQRKTSRTGSPRPSQAPSPRVPSGFRANSQLQSGYDDAAQDAHFHYQFSASTLARAQKAKEHLELMAEYRRLLGCLPLLKPGQDLQSTASPQNSPATAPKCNQVVLGRPYNPLQYIRNRKVRSRERKVIDGEHQGFGDVDCVRAWVSRVYQWNSVTSSTTTPQNGFTMPFFPGADDPEGQSSPENASKQAVRARRPRVDWFFDPCDMIADAYWLEQDHHKQLIEDRHWRKIFLPTTNISRPISRQVEEVDPDPISLSTKTADQEEVAGTQDMRLAHTDDGAQSSTRERAKQKLHDMKGFHHRHNSSVHGHHDFLRMRRDSLSDASGSESDLRSDNRRKGRQGRRETITSDANDLLQKQMMEIVAQEAKEKELANVPENDETGNTGHIAPSDPASPVKAPVAHAPSRSHSRKTSVADLSDSEARFNASRSRLGSPVRHYHRGRPSLDIPEDPRRGSIGDIYQSIPSSPKFEDAKDHTFSGQAGVNMSVASSRSGSPTRNPLSKVRRKLLDKTRDAGGESQSEDIDDETRLPNSAMEPPSPSEKIPNRPMDESYKTHRSTGSMRLRGDDQTVGLRGLFKGPRIDTVIREGVSKLGDVIWRREGSEYPSDDESTEESDMDVNGGRGRQSLSLSRRESRRLREDAQHGAKHFYDSMPLFRHVGDPQSRTSTGQGQKLGVPPDISRPQSRQSARWEQLKPPRIDVRSASPTSSVVLPSRPGESEVSDSESYQNSVPEGVRAADQRLNSVIGASMPGDIGRSPSRQWSITDRNPFPQRARLSKREIARMRTLILSSGIKAMEINRRANEMQKPLCKESLELAKQDPRNNLGGLLWGDIAKMTPDNNALHEQQVPTCDIYPLASRALGMAIQASGQRWQSSADQFTSKTSPSLQKRILEVRSTITDDLSQMTRRAADEADETSKELALDQPLKVKHVADVIEKLLRKRRRRFRWLRRGLWLAVEWGLVGFMWYVWFMVMILRIFLGIFKGIWGGARWLLWL